MKLIPDTHAIPTLYTTEDDINPTCQMKLFTPDANWTWYIIEMDETEGLCFGYVVGHECELGYFSLKELEEVRGSLSLPIERDLSFTPISLYSNILNRYMPLN